MSDPETQPEKREWRDASELFSSGAGRSGKAIGAVGALLLVIPFVGATFLGRAAGDTVTTIVLIIAALAEAIGGFALMGRRLLVMAILVWVFALACGAAAFVTVKVGW